MFSIRKPKLAGWQEEEECTAARQTVSEWRHGRPTSLSATQGRPSFGAGNCNDLDLEMFAASFAAVDLFDLDTKALARPAAPDRSGCKIAST
jgi:hypothetical protein